MRRRGYPDDVATGSIFAGGTLGILIPPSITFILYGIATETSIGRLLLAGVLPGLLLTGLFILWTLFIIWKRGFRAHAADFRYTWREKWGSIPKIAPFLAIVFGVMYVLYGGVATPSEAAGVGVAGRDRARSCSCDRFRRRASASRSSVLRRWRVDRWRVVRPHPSVDARTRPRSR
jgi:TRAP-type C4-dicarboxylate transport system permease large subunit